MIEDTETVDTVCGKATFRAPTRDEFRRATKAGLLVQERMADAIDLLARVCVVDPKPEVFSAWIDKRPAIPLVCANALMKLCGLQAEDEKKE